MRVYNGKYRYVRVFTRVEHIKYGKVSIVREPKQAIGHVYREDSMSVSPLNPRQ